ncbi:hypothetical protein CDAR_573531 [Caerostris darwini]|uniref:Uncharacterized protein n=1 Tax=Caerostris darwini TaxID=1538125 RepID=A0AAV4TA19_9ARAC|nr:hypothetical protein CDAR_573531 [Caerostris darwini]
MDQVSTSHLQHHFRGSLYGAQIINVESGSIPPEIDRKGSPLGNTTSNQYGTLRNAFHKQTKRGEKRYGKMLTIKFIPACRSKTLLASFQGRPHMSGRQGAKGISSLGSEKFNACHGA